MKNLDKICSLIFFLIISIEFLYPQTEQYKFRHLTTEDGLPTNRTNQILKDSHGMIWITTGSGLCRYDGMDFKIYQYDPSDPNSPTHNNLRLIIEDIGGNLWISTLWGLNKFDPVTETFTRYTQDSTTPGSISSYYIQSIYQDKQGTIWVGTGWDAELNKYDPLTDSFTSYPIIQQKDTSEIYLVCSIFEDSDSTFWVGTSHGLYQFDRQNKIATAIKPTQPLPENFIPAYRKIMEDKNGTLWFKTDYSILRYDRTGKDSAVLRPMWGEEIQFQDCFLNDMIVEPTNEGQILWVAAYCGLARINPASHDFIIYRSDPDDPISLIGNEFRGVYKDETDIIWVTSRHGLNILDKQRSLVKQHNIFYDEYETNATVLYEDSLNNFWIGTYGKGILLFDNQMNLIHRYNISTTDELDEKPVGMITIIYEDKDCNIWAGTTKGLYLLDREKNKFKECLLHGMNVGLKSHPYSINAICEDSDGIKWIGAEAGIYKNDRNSESLTNFTNVLINGYQMSRPVRSIIEDQHGWLWFGVDAFGIYCQPPELRGTDSYKQYKHDPGDDNSLSSSNVKALYEDRNGNLWIGTRNGLNRFIRKIDGFEQILFEDNPAANFIFDISEDEQQNIWLLTDEGLVRMQMEYTAIVTKQYNLKKVLQYKDIRPKGISKYRDGTIFIGGYSRSQNGYFTFHPAIMKDNQIIPPVTITEFEINNEVVRLDSNILYKKHIVLDYKESSFSFKFAALNYNDSEHNRYAYYLEGFENEWIYCGARRNAYYTKVPPGNYIFRVKGSNNDGYWNEKGVAIGISILPPPWKTWWAYIIYSLLILAVIYSIVHFYLRRQRLLHKLALEQVESEKLKELDSLKSRFFANISHEFRTPLTLIIGPLNNLKSQSKDQKTKNDLSLMERNARKLQNMINQLLNLSKLESGKMKIQAKELNIVAMVKGYIQSFESLARQKNIILTFKTVNENIQLFADQDKIEKILYNLLSNAFKFTGEGGSIDVSISLNEENSRVVISVSDTGIGIPSEKLEHIFDRFYQVDDSYTKDQQGTGIGLALTKELVELHHGKISVKSAIGQGTTIIVELPIGKEHLNQEEIIVCKDSSYESMVPEKSILESVEITDKVKETILSERKKTDNNDISKPILLIIEDNDDLRTYIRSYLNIDYRITEAIDGEKGLKKAIEEIPDLIISDVMMPKMDGYELCVKLKTDERTSHIPVILLTARAGRESKIEGLETGADDFITKPFDVEELQIRIKNLIDQRKKLQNWVLKETEKSGIKNILDLDSPDLTSIDQKFYQRILQLVIDNISNPDYSVEKLASQMNMSHSQLHRKMVAFTGQTANQFIRTIRLARAAELLVNKTATVTEIAFETGFNNLSYFAKCFREKYNVLPSEYTG